MYGFVGAMVFCRYHPHKRCEHFCEDHAQQLCSICLREKHRGCTVGDENSYKEYYGRRVRDAGHVIEEKKNDVIEKTNGVVHALDTGIVRLVKYQRDLDGVVKRLHEMKDEIEGQRAGIRQTSQNLRDIERSLTTANELKQCKQCYTDVDIERIKFERKQKKIIQSPVRFHDEIKIHFTGLSKKLKGVRNEMDSELTASQARLQLPDDGRAHSQLSNYNPPSMDISRKFAKMRGRHSVAASYGHGGRTHRRAIPGDDGRFTNYVYEKRVKLPALPGITQKPPHHRRRLDIKFPGFGAPGSAKDARWHMT